MRSFTKTRNLVITAVAVCAWLYAFYYFQFRSTSFSFISPSRNAWIHAASNTDVDGPFDSTPIRTLCATKKPTPGLVFSCNKANGGIGNVRNQLLGCIRYAIEAGGGLVMPRPVVRSANLIKTGTGVTTPFDYFFDTDHFTFHMEDACPNLKIYDSEEGLERHPAMLYPQTLGGEKKWGQVISDPQHWREKFDLWLKNETEFRNSAMPTDSKPLLVELDQELLLRQPVDADGPEFKNSFGRILQFRQDVRRLAATVIYELGKRFDLHLNATAQLHPNAYFGAHLRTEKDAVRFWDDATFEAQSEQYIAQAREHKFTAMYVASGNTTEIERMKEKALKEAGIKVTAKYELLNEEDSAYLRNMTWDQQALVDYEVLLKASDFGGFVKSTFAWNIALRRHILSEKDPYAGEAAMEDEYSHIYGKHDYKRRKNPWTAAIQWSMWP